MQMQTQVDTDLAHEVLTSIRQVVRRIAEHSKYLSREAGLTVPQVMCLKTIGKLHEEGGEINVVQVAKLVQLSAATVSRIIDRLERAGLVSRERRSADRRRVCLGLTPAGIDRYHTLPTPLQEEFVERFRALSDGDRREIFDVLRRIAELMDASHIEASPILVSEADIITEAEL